MSDEEIRAAAERELAGRAGVVSIGVGDKFRDGKLTDVAAVRIYVERKKPPGELSPEELIPPEFGGMPTDVLEPPEVVPFAVNPCEDREQHGTLTGGITISTLKDPNNKGPAYGTLGFMATIPGHTAPHNIALVTCNHVITEPYGGDVGYTIFQPAFPPNKDRDTVGTVWKLPPRAEVNGMYVDAAAVKLKLCFSSWCECNVGNSFDKDIKGLAIGGRNDIRKVGSGLKRDDIVTKVGRRTGRTEGTVKSVQATAKVKMKEGGVEVFKYFKNNIEIAPLNMKGPKNCGGALRFGDHGDSGAALIDANRDLVGLFWGGYDALPHLSYACHIQPVLSELTVVPITETNPVHGNLAAVGMRDDARGVVEGPDRRAELRGAVLATPAGRELAAEGDRHRHEVVHLVNHVRRVTIAWHRNQGPAFMNRLLANARDPDVPIPREIEGVTREQLLRAMHTVLAANGSDALREVLDARAGEVIEAAGAFDSLHDAVDALRVTA